MKKSLLILLALLLAASMLLCACSSDDVAPNTTEKTTTEEPSGNGGGNGGNKTPSGDDDEAPDGYEYYVYYDFRFAYPADWTVERLSKDRIRFTKPESHTALDFSAADDASIYHMISMENYHEFFTANMNITNMNIVTKTNNEGLSVKVASFHGLIEFGEADCYLFTVTAHGEKYAFSLADYDGSLTEEMVNTILNSMKELPKEQDADGYKTLTTNNFCFAYPETWLYEQNVEDSISIFTLNDVDIVMTYYVGGEAAQFQDEDTLLQTFPGEISNKESGWVENNNGLNIFLLTFHATLHGTPVDYYIFSTNIDGESYSLVISDTSGTLEETAEVIFHSMKIV